MDDTFKLETFEYLVYRRDYEPAARQLMSLLAMLDANLGSLGPKFSAQPSGLCVTGEDVDTHLLARLTAAITCLFSDPQFSLSSNGAAQLFNWHRWLSTIFAASPLRNADAVLRALNVRGPNVEQLEIRNADLVKACVLFGGDSRIPLDLDALWSMNPQLVAALCMSLLSPRFCGTLEAHAKREKILPWLSERLDHIQDLNTLPASILHDVYMHCSYADRADKHGIKAAINRLVRRKLDEWGLEERNTAPAVVNKPVLLVVLEWFNANHSIYRTHSRTLEAARREFHVIGIGMKFVDDAGRAVFDRFFELPEGALGDQLRFITEVAKEQGAHALYMPSVGMFPLTMFLANMRVAPLQAFALGHPATTHSSEMDHVVVEEHYVGDPACFSEKLLLLPEDGMPYRPAAAMDQMQWTGEFRERPEVVRIAVAATTMKLNPGFLSTLARIATDCGRPIEYHFLVGHAFGLVYEQVAQVIRQFLGDKAVVHRHQAYPEYMRTIGQCELFLNPFPFGNTNGIVDTVSAGLVGVCKTGREVHEHIDEGMFKRMKMPTWLVTHTNEEYAAAAIRLIQNDDERNALRRQYAGRDKVKVLFEGRPEIFGQKLRKLVAQRPARTPGRGAKQTAAASL